MRIGPFSSFHIDKIKTLCEEINIEYTLYQDPDAVAKIQEIEKSRPKEIYPTYRSTGEYIYFDISDADYQKMTPYLEKYGIIGTF